MNKIEVAVLNPEAVHQAEKMMVCAGRLTQRGHCIKDMADFLALYEKPYTEKTAMGMCQLPHSTLQRFDCINVAVIGASRRFLAQITRHQAGVTFMSGSLQYSNYSQDAAFTVPYEVLQKGEDAIDAYQAACAASMQSYIDAIQQGLDNDSAGYMAPQGLRNVLIISANPLALQHMISQRVCRRNTSETRYVMLRIWQELYPLSFLFQFCEPACMNGNCREGIMTCNNPVSVVTPNALLQKDFPLLAQEIPEMEMAWLTTVRPGYCVSWK